MREEVPTCDGCGAKGYYGVCDECRTPNHSAEDRNHNIAQPDNHNLYNFQEW